MSTIMRIGRKVAFIATIVAVSMAVPRGAAAQSKIELTPFVGNFYPLLTMANDVFGGVDPFTGAADGSHWKAKQIDAVALGGRLTYWLSNTMGVEAAGTYTKSSATLSSPGDTSSLTAKGNIVVANARFLYRPGRLNLHFILGAGVVRRGGTFWRGGEKLTRPAGVLGMAVRAVVSPKFALNVSAEANVYSFDIDGSGTTNKSKLQSDLLVAIGVPITLSH